LIISVARDQGYDRDKHRELWKQRDGIGEGFLEEVISDSYPVSLFQPMLVAL